MSGQQAFVLGSHMSGVHLGEYLAGLNWLRLNWYVRRNVILGDEMGLGKTVQALAMLQSLRSLEGIGGPFLIIAPLSTVPHWEREIAMWTDMYAVTYHGSADSRSVILDHDWHEKCPRGKAVPRGRVTYRFHVALTTYEMLLQQPEPLVPRYSPRYSPRYRRTIRSRDAA